MDDELRIEPTLSPPGEQPAQGATPLQPAQGATPLQPDKGPSRNRTGGISRLRVGIVSGAAVALAVGAVATGFAASPPVASVASTGSATTSAWIAPAALDGAAVDGAGGFDHGRFGGPGGFRDITITAISGSSLSLATADGWTRTVAVTDAVTLTKGGQAITLSGLAVGDEIRLLQARADDGTFTVTGIEVVVPRVAGTVSELSSSGFKVTGRDGAVWTIAVTSDTTYRYGAADGTAADVANGDMVLVLGTSTGDNALTATSVTVPGDRAAGTVTATTSSSITMTDRSGTSITIHVDADTIYRTAGATTATLADIAVGDVIGVSGRARSDGSIDAAAVMEGRGSRGELGEGPGFGGRGGRGGPGFGPGLDDGADTSTDAS